MLSNITLEELIKEAYKAYTKKLNKKVKNASNRPLKNKKKLRKIQRRNEICIKNGWKNTIRSFFQRKNG